MLLNEILTQLVEDINEEIRLLQIQYDEAQQKVAQAKGAIAALAWSLETIKHRLSQSDKEN